MNWIDVKDELLAEIERLKLVQQIWCLKKYPEISLQLQWKIIGIEFCIDKLQKQNQ